MIRLRFAVLLCAAIAVPACDAIPRSSLGYPIDHMSSVGLTMQEELEIYVGNWIIFEPGGSDLSPRAEDTLRRIGLWMADRPDVALLIGGHAVDSGTREDDLLLAASRALVALDHLVALGVDESRLKAVSYGQERPAAQGSPVADDYNRRVDFVVFSGW